MVAPVVTTEADIARRGKARDNRWVALGILALAQLMVVLDAAIVNVALPAMQKDLGFASTGDLEWVVNAYTLAFGGFLLLGGRIADRLGRRRVFMSGVTLFVLASLVGGFAQSPGILIGSRAVQGLGGALMAPAALSLVTVIFQEGRERNTALGVWGAMSGGGAAIGVLLGGILTDGLSWRWVLFVNVPIGLAGLLAAPIVLPESRDDRHAGFDISGAVTVTGGLVALVYALLKANEVGWASVQTVLLLAASAVLLTVFFRLQARGRAPLMPLRLFRSRSLLGSDIGVLLVGAGMFAMFFFITLYLQEVLGYSALKTGVAFLPVALTVIVSAGVGSQLLNRFGPRPVLVTGMLTAAAGLLLLTRVHPGGGYVTTVLLPLLVVAGGLGASFVSLTSTAVAGVPQEDSGLASALVNTGQQVGGALGLALLTAVSNARFDAVKPANPADHAATLAATTSGWAWAFAVGAVLLAAGALVSAVTVRVGRSEVEQASVPAAA